MNFTPDSINRLNDFKRKLPSKLETHKDLDSPNNLVNRKVHPIETEKDPEKLFHELMKASTDGSIPPHLINQLKKLEKKNNLHIKENDTAPSRKAKPSGNRSFAKSNSLKDEDNLYLAFQNLLLEEED